MEHQTVIELQKILGTNNLQEAIEQAGKYQETLAPIVAVPSGLEIQSLERFGVTPPLKRGSIATQDLDSLVDYVAINKEDRTACFIDAESLTAEVILDYGFRDNPGHCKHGITLSPKKSPEYLEVLRADGNSFSQRELAEWIEEFRDCMTFYRGENELSSIKVVSAIREIKKQAARESESRVNDFSTGSSIIEQVKVDDDNLPGTIVIKTKPLDFLDERAFHLHVSMVGQGDETRFKLRWLRRSIVENEIAADFAFVVAKRLEEDDGAEPNVFIGRRN